MTDEELNRRFDQLETSIGIPARDGGADGTDNARDGRVDIIDNARHGSADVRNNARHADRNLRGLERFARGNFSRMHAWKYPTTTSTSG